MVALEGVNALKFTVERARAIAEAGLFGTDFFEVIDGVVVETVPERFPHNESANLLYEALREIYGTRARLTLPVEIDEFTLVYPDVCVRREAVPWHTPAPGEMQIVAEISRTSMTYDLGLKARTYARACIPEYAVLVVPRRELVLHTSPTTDGYTDIHTLTEHEEYAGHPITSYLPPLS